ncbi:RNA-directed DNA polymerase from mobile element jockey [Plakobranchus ocellatus]|uniref:RNA-directed DNA polymerase from mobile element jockey n=1 Tax=Plakobranchus ocellatus TaxID=259542 RepID=A0AAV4BG45_9GAST|nr:RNA-directed DNA polymerase from mobile element jockey [Plakobranchus ocellatus]
MPPYFASEVSASSSTLLFRFLLLGCCGLLRSRRHVEGSFYNFSPKQAKPFQILPPPLAEKPQGPLPSPSLPYPLTPEVHVMEGVKQPKKIKGLVGQPKGGTCISEIDLKTGLHAAAATISLEKTLTVCSLYLPPNSPVSKLFLAELFEQLLKPFLVLGHFNALSSVGELLPRWAGEDARRVHS